MPRALAFVRLFSLVWEQQGSLQIYSQISLAASIYTGAARVLNSPPRWMILEEKKKSCSCFSFSILGKAFQLGAGRDPELTLHPEETLS